MKIIAKIAVAVAANAAGLWSAAYFLPGFVLQNDLVSILILASILTALNFVLKPILKIFFIPIIILTLGLGLIIINALILYILDIISSSLTIENIPTLIYASLIIGFVNFVFHLATK